MFQASGLGTCLGELLELTWIDGGPGLGELGIGLGRLERSGGFREGTKGAMVQETGAENLRKGSR